VIILGFRRGLQNRQQTINEKRLSVGWKEGLFRARAAVGRAELEWPNPSDCIQKQKEALKNGREGGLGGRGMHR
jgi:hypothetical protein